MIESISFGAGKAPQFLQPENAVEADDFNIGEDKPMMMEVEEDAQIGEQQEDYFDKQQEEQVISGPGGTDDDNEKD